MSRKLYPDGTVGFHLMVPVPLRTKIQESADENGWTVSEELRHTLHHAYRSEDPEKKKLPPGFNTTG